MADGHQGTLVLVNGPTGSGKGSLVTYARSLYPTIEFSVSCTTRAPRPGEVDAVDYYFITPDEFKRRIEAGDFVEWAQYGGNYYGTLKSEILPRLERGAIILLEIELQGVEQVLKIIPAEQLLTIFVDAGTWEQLERRITARAPISPEELAKRKERYAAEIHFKHDAKVVIQNPDGGLDAAKEQFVQVLAPLVALANA